MSTKKEVIHKEKGFSTACKRDLLTCHCRTAKRWNKVTCKQCLAKRERPAKRATTKAELAKATNKQG